MQQSNTMLLEEFAANAADKILVRLFEQEDVYTHDHNCFELAYVVEGSAVQTLNGEKQTVRQGTYFIIDYGSKHNYRECRNFKLINCLFKPEMVDAALVNCRSFDELMRVCMIRYYKQYFGLTPVNRIFQDEDGKVLNLLRGMQEEYENQNIGYEEIFKGRLLEILILSVRKVVKQCAVVSGERLAKSEVVQEVVRYLETNYMDKAVLSNFCEKYHYSLQYVSRRFKQETGMTALAYLQKIRIEKSCALLAGGSSVQESAYLVGYEDIKFFRRVFRKTVGMTPVEYRKTAVQP